MGAQTREAFETLVRQWQEYAGYYQKQCEQWRDWFDQATAAGGGPLSPEAQQQAENQYRRQLADIESQLQFGWQQYEQLTHRLADVETEAAAAKAAHPPPPVAPPQAMSTESARKMKELESSLKHLTREHDALKKEQEDLLVLLADQDQKLEEYKRYVITLGGKIDDDEDDERRDDVSPTPETPMQPHRQLQPQQQQQPYFVDERSMYQRYQQQNDAPPFDGAYHRAAAETSAAISLL